MINLIYNEESLKDYLHHQIKDSGVEVQVDQTLTTKEFVGIKVDDYYNKIMPMTAPKAVDFVVTVDCQCNTYALYILELKNIKKSKNLKIKDIIDKFDNTINDFINKRYNHIFLNPSFKYKKVLLFLVADIYNECQKRVHHSQEKRDSLKTDVTLGKKVYKIHGKLCCIKYEIPPNPLIKRFT